MRRGRGSYQMARFLRERTRIGTLINGIDTGISSLRRRNSRRRRVLKGMVGMVPRAFEESGPRSHGVKASGSRVPFFVFK